jgi:NADPH-dependent 2,4-dienoyl-CoA reductase/sulfur reductase-like enzyme
MSGPKIVVIGADAAGMSAASLAKRRRPELQIEAFEMGRHTSYGACGIPYYVAGLIPDLNDLVVVTPKEFEEKRGIRVHMRTRVDRIHPDAQTIEATDLETGRRVEAGYDELVISTGAEPIVPPGIDPNLDGVFTLRGLPDAAGITEYIADHGAKHGLVVGTGYIGMEMAEALRAAGLDVTVVGRRPRVMPGYEPEIADLVEKELIHQGVTLRTGVEAAQVQRNGRLNVTMTDGSSLSTDIVVVGAGVRPRSQLAEEAGLKVGVKKAVAVDRRQRTSHEHIWSAGDCAEVFHYLTGKNAYIPLALGANRQGRIVGLNLSGSPAEFPGVVGSAICKVFNLAAARTGLNMAEAQSMGLDVSKVVVASRSRPHYYPGSAPIVSVLIVEKKTKKVWGAQMAGEDGVGQRINTWAAVLYAGFNLDQVYAMDLAYAPPFSPVWDPVLQASEVALKQVK